VIGLAVAAAMLWPRTVAADDPPGWALTWQDEFEGTTLDAGKWTPESTNDPANNEQQAYRPAQVTVSGGNMVITSEKRRTGPKDFVSGRVHSNYAQRHGRWEVRADLPTSRGMWPAIWLLPDTSQYNWPSQGEIDIMENRGTQPNLTSSAYHYGTNPPYFHDFRFAEQTTARFGEPVNYHTGFHTYAAEWDATKVRFFVDDVHHWTIYNSEIDGYLASQTAPMRTMLNTAVGGQFLGEAQPDATTVWPQQFLIDYVRIYERNDDPLPFRNGDFEASDGSLAHWSVFGNRVNTNNVAVHDEAARGEASLKLFGQFTGGANTSGASQGMSVVAGQELRATAESFIRAADSLAGTSNSVVMKIEFYNEFGGKRSSPAFLNEVVATIANGSSPNNVWRPHELLATAPAGAVEARLALVFLQTAANGAGAVHIDNVSFGVIAPLEGDFNGDGRVDADDLGVWHGDFGAETGVAADANGDGVADGADFLMWQRQLGAINGAANAAAAPEPPANLLLMTLWPVVVRCRAGLAL
jgi:beta-glucanase (GH16 family)